MKILIATGIYPPDIGGPAQYARNLYETWKKQGHDVKVAAYRWERAFPPLVRHILYFLKIIRKGWNADLILVLDTWSAAVPAMAACALMRKKYLLRTGGDFLWETYVERTGDLVLLRDFYGARMERLTRKEKLIFKLGGLAMRRASALIFSTEWQKDLFMPIYRLDPKKCSIVMDFCGEREGFIEPEKRCFIAGTRSIKCKNSDLLKEAFAEARQEILRRGLPDISIDFGKAVHDSFIEKIRRSYGVISVSLGDPSSALIWDAVRTGVPFIMSSQNGISGILNGASVEADPLNKKEIAEKIIWLADPQNRSAQSKKVQSLKMVNSWEQIGQAIASLCSRK